MGRPTTERVQRIKEKLIERVRDGYRRPGDRFLSTRQIADLYGVSFQTAHRLGRQLVDEGWLVRRNRAGTYLAGETPGPFQVVLVFDPRAEREDSFGWRLKHSLTDQLNQLQIPWEEESPTDYRPSPDRYPVIWEAPKAVRRIAAVPRLGLLLNSRPPPGLAATFIDSVETDDDSGGTCAGELLRDRFACTNPMMIAGPKHDPRSNARHAGVNRIYPGVHVRYCGGWFYEDAVARIRTLRLGAYDGFFCANDRLAQALLESGRVPEARPIIGFDDAPVAEQLHLTTISIHWDEQAGAAARIIARRRDGGHQPAIRYIISPRPVVR